MRAKHNGRGTGAAFTQKSQALALLLGLSLGVWSQASYASADCTGNNATANFIQGTTSDDGVASAMNWSTGLVWQQCSVGQTGASCSGTATSKKWVEWNNSYAPLVYSDPPVSLTANRLTSGAWRTPYLHELYGLAPGCSVPTSFINDTVFPNTPTLSFWPASQFAPDLSRAWFVYFFNGSSDVRDKAAPSPVRLVRSGQSFSLFDSSDNQSMSANAGSQVVFITTSLKAPADTVAWGGARISGDGGPKFQVNGAGAWVTQAIVSSNDQLTVSMTAGSAGTIGTATLTLHSGQTTGETTDTSTWGNGATVMKETKATFELKSNRLVQTITTPAASPAAPVYASNGTFTVSGTAGASTSPLSYSSQTTSICTVSDASKNSVTMRGAGDCSIAFDQAGDSTYAAAPQVTLTVPIAKAAQTLSFSSAAPTNAKVGDNYAVTTNPGSSTSTATLAVTGNCSLAGSTVSFDTAGSCTVTASQKGDANYLDAADVTQTFSIGKGDQTLAISSTAPTNAKVGGSYTVTTTSGKSTSLVTLAVTGNCSLAGSTVSLDAYGSCSVTASQIGDANYLDAADVTQTFSIAQSGTGVNIISTPNPSQPGQDVAFSVSVVLDNSKSLKAQSSLTKAVAVPTGTVTLTDGTTTLGTATLDASGNATLTVKSLTTVGAHSIVASYSGDTNYPAFQSAAFTQTVSVAAVATPVPLFGEWWEKLLLSLMVVGVSALMLRMRRAA